MKLIDALDGYWLDRRLNLSEHTVRDYTLTFKRFIEFMPANIQIEHITSTDIRKFLNHLPEKYPNLGKHTLSNHWIALSALWTWAEAEWNIPHIIRQKVQRPRYKDKIPAPFTQVETKAIVRATRTTRTWQVKNGKRVESNRYTRLRDEAIVLTLLDTGLRASELCALEIKDYDQSRGRIHIRRGKGDKERYVVVGSRTRKLIWRYLIDRDEPAQNDPLFATRSNQHIRRDNLYNMLLTIGKNAKVSNVHPHRFRHTFAIQFLRNGGSVFLLRELLGHESIEMVMRYARLAEQDIDKAGTHSPVDGWNLA